MKPFTRREALDAVKSLETILGRTPQSQPILTQARRLLIAGDHDRTVSWVHTQIATRDLSPSARTLLATVLYEAMRSPVPNPERRAAMADVHASWAGTGDELVQAADELVRAGRLAISLSDRAYRVGSLTMLRSRPS
jgi:hypothetical protein